MPISMTKMRMAELPSVAKEFLDSAIGGRQTGAQGKNTAHEKVKSTNFYLLWRSAYKLAVARALVWQKFYQQVEVRQYILDHINMHLFVEASPRDEYFGCGRDLEEPMCFFLSQYKYENVLGLLYAEVALHFTEFGPQEFVNEEGQVLTGEQLAKRQQIVWDRMQAAVLNYQAVHPPYFDLPGEPYDTRYLWDPKVGDATLPPGSGVIIRAAFFQVGEDWQHKPAKNLELFVEQQPRYFPSAMLIRRRMRAVRRGQHQWLYRYRRPRSIIIPWQPAPI